MPGQEITQLRIGSSLIGIVGLDDIMKSMGDAYARSSDKEIGEEMVTRLETVNYIPRSARELYAGTLAREYRRRLGQNVEEETMAGLRVVILGPGCAQCDRMEMDVREVMSEMQLAAELDHVTDMKEIGRYGVMGVPALIVNDKVVCVGQTPNRKKIREWLREASKTV